MIIPFLPMIFILIVFITIFTCIKIVPQDSAIVIERQGVYHRTQTSGVYFMIPFVEKATRTINLKEQNINYSTTVSTSDSASKKANTEVYFQIINPEVYACTSEEPVKQIEKMIKLQLLENINMYGQSELAGKEIAISERIIATLNADTRQWGIKITRLYINII